jgi:hypothetical protein
VDAPVLVAHPPGAVVDDDPFHAVFWIGLVTDTFDNGLDERSAVECGC